MKSNSKSLGLFLFLGAIITLFLNDFYFKFLIPGFITGKLSDVVGLYAFAWFLSSLVSRHKTLVHVLVALFFIFWKTPYSSSFILWFSTQFYTIDRVVDYTDYLALPVLGLSWYLSPGNLNVIPKSYLRNTVILFSCFAFAATSMPPNLMEFKVPQVLLLDKQLVTEIHLQNNHSYEVDSFIVFYLDQVEVSRGELYGDDFDQKFVIGELGEIHQCQSYDSINVKPVILKSLFAKGKIAIKHKFGDYVYDLSFLDGRLNGSYKEYYKNTLQLSAFYRLGLPDSTWRYYDQNGQLLKQCIYEYGERTNETTYINQKESGVKSFQTRKDIQHDYWIVLIVTVLISLGIIFILHFKYQYSRMFLTIWKRLLILLIMLLVSCLILIAGINLLELQSDGVFGYILIVVLSMTVSVPILLLLSYFLPFENYFDVVIYGILFGLLWLILYESFFIKKLTKGAIIIDCFSMTVVS